MRTNLIKFSIVIVVGVLIFPVINANPPPQRAQIDRIRRGMTPEEVRPLVGQPQQISRQILLRHHVEQWQFEEPATFIEWNCQRGEIPYVFQAQKLKDE